MCLEYNAAVIGCGAIGPVHAAAIDKCVNAKLYAVCDVVTERADRLAKQYNCKAYYSLEDTLNDPEIQSIHICTAHYLHLPMALAVIKAGKQLVIEKPLGLDINEAKQLVDSIEAGDVKACAIMQNRYNNSIRAALTIIEDGSLGKLLGIKGILTWQRTPEYYASEAWRGKWETEGGGLIINQAVHMLDLMHYLGGEVEYLKGSIDTRVLNDYIEVEDTAEATLYYKRGVLGHFFATNGYSTSSPFYLELHLEKGTLRYLDDELTLITDRERKVITNDNASLAYKKYWGSGHETAIASFYNALANKDNNYITPRQALPSMAIVSALYSSAKTNSKIKL